MNIKSTIKNLTSNPKRLFLIDGLGAFLTALLLSLVLTKFQPLFGMPKTVLYYLSLIAIALTIYSFTCHFRQSKNWKPYLIVISIANSLYSCLTMGLVFYYFQELTLIGVLYFISEILIITFLVVLELKTYTNLTAKL